MRHAVPIHLRAQMLKGDQPEGSEPKVRVRRTIRKSTRGGPNIQQRKKFLSLGLVSENPEGN